MEHCDLLLLQEHWMLNYEVRLLAELFEDNIYHAKCVDDNSPDLPMFRRRGRAGTAAIWKRNVECLIEPVLEGSDRILMLKVMSDPPILVINSYMPTLGSADPEYAEVLDEVHEVLTKYSSWDILWTGDLNADIRRDKGYQNDKMLGNFMNEHKLVISSWQPPTATYHHFIGGSSSRLDVFIEKQGHEIISDVKVDSRHPLNTSSHDAVFALFDVTQIQADREDHSENLPTPKSRIRWDKIDLQRYEELTNNKLQPLLKIIRDTPLDVTTEMLNTALDESALEASPVPPRRRKKTRSNPWTPKMKKLVQNVKRLYYESKSTEEENRIHNIAALKTAKKLLRRAQRQAAAKRRNETKSAIITSCKRRDKTEFFKLVKKQRSVNAPSGSVDFGQFKADNDPNSWSNYFENLATSKDNDTFSEEHRRHLQLMHILISFKPQNKQLPEVSTQQVSKYVGEMKKGKSPDLFGISAEHIRMAAPVIVDLICHICNESIRAGRLPLAAKMGVLSPILKKGKSYRDPNNYRRITISSLVGKILEKHMLHLTEKILLESQSRLQFGFTADCSPMLAALMVTEVMAEAEEHKNTLYITFMDSSKAFDVVNHHSLLKALHDQGIRGNLWRMYDDMYQGITSTVKWEGKLSRAFNEEQGIRQGGITSPALYKSGRNLGLNQLDRYPTLQIGSINVGAVMVADDLALTASSQIEMQKALLIAESDASRERYSYNPDKTKTVIVNGKNETTAFVLNGKPLGTSEREKHLGIFRNSKNSNQDTIETRIADARRASYSLLGAGLCGLNGTGPEVGIFLYSTYIIPILLYGLEALVLREKEIQILESYHRRNLRHILHLPQSTATPAIYLLSGCPPLEAYIHIRTLSLFRSLSDADRKPSPVRLVNEVIGRQLAMKDIDSSSWASWVKRILLNYDLPNAFSIYENPPDKHRWGRMVRDVVYSTWTDRLLEQSSSMSSLKHLVCDDLKLGTIHRSLIGTGGSSETQKIAVTCKLLVGRYPLATNRTGGTRSTKECPLCKDEDETEKHFLLHCKALNQARLPYLHRILIHLRVKQISIDPEDLTAFLVDPCGHKGSQEVSTLCRNMIFGLHNARSRLLSPDSSRILNY